MNSVSLKRHEVHLWEAVRRNKLMNKSAKNFSWKAEGERRLRNPFSWKAEGERGGRKS